MATKTKTKTKTKAAKATRAKRIRSPHPGVVLIKPDASHDYWRARYDDPETGRRVKQRLDPAVIANKDKRREFACKLSTHLARAKMERAATPGAKPKLTRPLGEALDVYIANRSKELKPVTLRGYELATKLLREWAKSEGVTETQEILSTSLPDLRSFLAGLKKTRHAACEVRGSRRSNAEKLSPVSINTWIRATVTVLHFWRVRGLVPLTRDEIEDAMTRVEVPKDPPDFLTQDECREVLEAALRHDAETFTATREEHPKRRTRKGRTLRYDPIAPFCLFVLLTGMRCKEALEVQWKNVRLDARDADGNVVGEIKLLGAQTKTGVYRTVTLAVSPSVRALLVALKSYAGNDPGAYVFGGEKPLPRSLVESARRRLIGATSPAPRKKHPQRRRSKRPPQDYGAPRRLTWQLLRSTCATYGCNAPGVWGDAAAFSSAKRLGHSVSIAERHYAGVVSVSRDARTLEAAMGVEALARRIVARVEGVELDDVPEVVDVAAE